MGRLRKHGRLVVQTVTHTPRPEESLKIINHPSGMGALVRAQCQDLLAHSFHTDQDHRQDQGVSVTVDQGGGHQNHRDHPLWRVAFRSTLRVYCLPFL